MWTLLCASALALDPPTPREPVDGEAVATLSPTLVVDNPTDSDATLNFELYAGEDGTDVLESRSGMRQGTGATEDGTSAWTVPLTLDEDTVYSWVVYSENSDGVSDASDRAVFRTNASNQDPGAPALVGPTHQLTVTDPPTFEVLAGEDVDGDSTLVVFVVLGPDGSLLELGTAQGAADASVTWTPSQRLASEARRCWYAYTLDELGARSDQTETWCFFAAADNQSPSMPSVITVDDGAVLDASPVLSVDGCSDPEGQQVWLTWSTETASETVLVGDEGPWSWDTLLEDGDWTLTVSCTDGEATSEESTIRFTVSADARAPDAPSGLIPDGETVEGDATLSWEPANDPDSDALTYRVQVWDEGGWLLDDQSVSTTSTTVVADWTAGTYTWTVTATDEGGLTGATTAATFTVEGSAQPDTGRIGTDGRSCASAGMGLAGPLWLLLPLLGHRRRR